MCEYLDRAMCLCDCGWISVVLCRCLEQRFDLLMQVYLVQLCLPVGQM